MGLVKEFKEFALKGNVMDMAVGVIVGGAFGTIVKSVIDDIVMPVVGIAGKADFSNMYFGLTDKVRQAIATASVGDAVPSLEEARKLGPVMAYGSFITVVVNFLILAACIFLMVKAMNTAKKKFEKEKEAAPPAEAPADVKLLGEIRDLLKSRG